MSISKDNSFVIADIPGLIEGAHKGVGLGHEFLKHIERTRLLIHVIDISGIEGRNPVDDFYKITNELKEYSGDLAKRPQIIAANKIDLLSDYKVFEDFKQKLEGEGYKVFEISAATNKGIRELMSYAAEELKNIPMPIVKRDVNKEIVYKFKEENLLALELKMEYI